MTSDDERTRILQMVSAGTISPEQAGVLLETLDADDLADNPSAESRPVHDPQSGPQRTFRFTPRELVELRMHGVSPEYVRQLQDLGLTDLPFQTILELAMHGIDGEFVREVRDAGYTDLNTPDLIQLGTHGVDVDYIREMREAGYGHLPIEQLVEFRMHGVDAEYM